MSYTAINVRKIYLEEWEKFRVEKEFEDLLYGNFEITEEFLDHIYEVEIGTYVLE